MTRNLSKFMKDSIFFPLSRKLKEICEMRDKIDSWYNGTIRKRCKETNVMAGIKLILETIKYKIHMG